jgi:hypothetical protein
MIQDRSRRAALRASYARLAAIADELGVNR